MEISTQEGYEGVLPGSPPAEGKEWKQDWATVQVPRRPQPAPREALKPGVGTGAGPLYPSPVIHWIQAALGSWLALGQSSSLLLRQSPRGPDS